MIISGYSARIAGIAGRVLFAKPGRSAAGVTFAGALLACGPQKADSTASAADTITTSGSTTGPLAGSDTSGDGTSTSTTGADGPYVYEDQVALLDSPPRRTGFTLEALPGGRALLIGGLVADGPDADSDADVAAGTLLWRPEEGFVAGPELQQARFEHDSAALSDGSILVFSGRSNHELDAKLVEVERIDPEGLTSAVVGALTEARHVVTAIAEPGDTVVVLGDSAVTAERFDPSTGISTPLPVEVEFPFFSAFFAPLFSAARRGNGEIVALGGFDAFEDATFITQGPQAIDLDGNSSRPIGADAGEQADFSRQALTLPDGSVLLLGSPRRGHLPGPWLVRLDAATDTLTTLQELADPATPFHRPPVGVVLADGRVWIVGEPGEEPGVATHFYDPATDALTPGPPLPTPTIPLAAVLLDSGPVLLLGGSEGPTLSAFLLE
jgi:hypothetical protein